VPGGIEPAWRSIKLFGPRLGRRSGLGSTECRPRPCPHYRQPVDKDLANSLGPQQCVELGGAHDGLTPTLRCFQGPLAFDVRGAVGAKTEIAGAASDSEEVMLWYENVVKPVARAAGAHVQV
jgi:hypothetical protein